MQKEKVHSLMLQAFRFDSQGFSLDNRSMLLTDSWAVVHNHPVSMTMHPVLLGSSKTAQCIPPV